LAYTAGQPELGDATVHQRPVRRQTGAYMTLPVFVLGTADWVTEAWTLRWSHSACCLLAVGCVQYSLRRRVVTHLLRSEYSKPTTIAAPEDVSFGSLSFLVDLDRHFYTSAPEESNGGELFIRGSTCTLAPVRPNGIRYGFILSSK
jgi:hypothetical protein